MANKNWDKWYVRCPFFARDDGKKTICCEGITEGCKINLTFKSKDDYAIHVATFCKEHFERCEIHRAVMMQYED